MEEQKGLPMVVSKSLEGKIKLLLQLVGALLVEGGR